LPGILHGDEEGEEMTERCKTTVYPNDQYGAFHGHQCKKPVWKDGYCKVHHPEAVEQRSKDATERWNQKWANSPQMQLHNALEEIKTLRAALAAAEEARDELLEERRIEK
jgi:hypothetical protein